MSTPADPRSEATPDHVSTDLPRPAKNPPALGTAYGIPAADFIHFLRRHGLDDRVDGYGIHIYYSTPSNIDSALSICDGAGRMPCWLTEWGGFSTTDVSCPLGNGPGDDVNRFNLVSKVRETLRPFASRGARSTRCIIPGTPAAPFTSRDATRHPERKAGDRIVGISHSL